MSTRMVQRKGTYQQWFDTNPKLISGEIGYETDTNKFKIGDGLNNWNDLTYFIDDSQLTTMIQEFATEEYVDLAVLNAEVNLPGSAGVGIDWNSTTSQFDIDSTVATKTYADGVVPSQTGNSGKFLTTNGTNSSWGTASVGKIVQIVRGSTSSIVTANITSSQVNTGLSATITPTSASNKIVIFVNQNGLRKLSGTADFSLLFQMLRGVTHVGYFGGSTLWTGDTSTSSGDVSAVFIDTPGTTSQITYSTKVGRAVSSSNSVDQTGFIYMQFLTGESTMLLMEVTP